MSRKKNDKPGDSMEEHEEQPTEKKAPWAAEVEFFNKPSFMGSVVEIRIDSERVVVVKDDGSIHTLPYSNVHKVLVMNTSKRKYSD